MNIRKNGRYLCPIDVTLRVLDGKWKSLILYHLKSAPRRYSVLQRKMPEISHKVLTQQLRALEADGIVCRVHLQTSNSLAYELTEFGRTLKPALTTLAQWGKKHHLKLGVRLIWRA